MRGREPSCDGPSALLLDLDGTLADSVYAQVAAWQQALAGQGLEIPGWRVHHLLGLGLGVIDEELARRSHPPISAEGAKLLAAAHAEAIAPLLGGIRPCPGADGLSAAVERLKLPTAVVTGGGRDVAEQLLRGAVGHTRWELIVAGADTAAKPAPDSVELAARRLGVPPDGCWFVGDSIWDMQAAVAAGARAVAVRTGGRSAAELREAGAEEVFDDLGGVAAALSGESAERSDRAIAEPAR